MTKHPSYRARDQPESGSASQHRKDKIMHKFEKRDAKSRTLVILAVVGLAAALTLGIFTAVRMLRKPPASKDDPKTGIVYDDSAVEGGWDNLSPEEIAEKLNEKVAEGMINISMNTAPYFEDGKAEGNVMIVGFVVACAECGLEYSSGRADIKGTAMNLIKGFMAVSLFTVVPIRLYELCVSLQANFGYAISGAGASFGTVAGNIIDELTVENFVDFATTHVGGFGSVTSPIMVLFCIILMAYAVIKVFFANLKRGGILLIQIAVGSLYMFSVPRGYLDGFYQWCKQVVGLCLTAFLQATILIAGLSLFNEHALLGLGLMLSAGEIPRIAGAFGLDTSTRANLSSAVYTAQTAINITKTVAKAAAA